MDPPIIHGFDGADTTNQALKVSSSLCFRSFGEKRIDIMIDVACYSIIFVGISKKM